MDLKQKIENSKRTLRLAAEMSETYYGKPMILCYSGGKDSDVLLHLAMSCLNPSDFEILNSHTSVDAPETVYHIRKVLENARGGGYRSKYPLSRKGWQKADDVETHRTEENATYTNSQILLLCFERDKHAEQDGGVRSESGRKHQTTGARRFRCEGGVITGSYLFFA